MPFRKRRRMPDSPPSSNIISLRDVLLQRGETLTAQCLQSRRRVALVEALDRNIPPKNLDDKVRAYVAQYID